MTIHTLSPLDGRYENGTALGEGAGYMMKKYAQG